MRYTIFALILASTLSAGNVSLSLWGDVSNNFTLHSDNADTITPGSHTISLGPSETATIYDKVSPKLQFGSFSALSNYNVGLSFMWKRYGMDLGFRQYNGYNLRTTVITYSDTQQFNYIGKGTMNGIYISPFVSFSVSESTFLTLGCKGGILFANGLLINQYTSDAPFSTPYVATYDYTGTGYFVEPFIRQSVFLTNHYALSVEFSYSYIAVDNISINGPTSYQKLPTSGPVFGTFGPTKITSPSFTIADSVFSIRVRLDTLFFNAFAKKKKTYDEMLPEFPPAPVLDLTN